MGSHDDNSWEEVGVGIAVVLSSSKTLIKTKQTCYILVRRFGVKLQWGLLVDHGRDLMDR